MPSPGLYVPASWPGTSAAEDYAILKVKTLATRSYQLSHLHVLMSHTRSKRD